MHPNRILDAIAVQFQKNTSLCISQNVTWLFNDQDMDVFLCSAVGQIIQSTVLTPKPERAVFVSLAHVQNT